MENKSEKPSLSSHGYQLVKTNNLEYLDIFKNDLSKFLIKRFSLPKQDPNLILNNIHKIANINTDKKANDLVLEVINKFSKSYDFAEIAFKLYGTQIQKLLGPDLHAQRNNNIVFQYPNSSRFSELHTDCPPNSPYEIVLWIPLVDCYDSKSFFVLPVEQSRNLINKYKSNNFNNWSDFKKESLSKAYHVKVEYSEALLFWTGIMHGSLTNQTSESRWCLNVRFKNLFAPCGQNDPLTYYKVFRTSTISNLAFNHL